MKIGMINRIGRYEYLWDILKKNHDVSIINTVAQYDVLIYGLLYVDEKMIDSCCNKVIVCGHATDWIKEHNHVICLLEDEEFLVNNAWVTAWGILEILLRHSMQCIDELCIDVVGYGRCGKALVRLFDALHISYRVIVKELKNYNFEAIHFEEYLFKKPNPWIIQTADCCIFDKHWVQRCKGETSIIDITSNFVGTKDIQNEMIMILYAKALPDLYCSKSGGVIYYDAIKRDLICN